MYNNNYCSGKYSYSPHGGLIALNPLAPLEIPVYFRLNIFWSIIAGLIITESVSRQDEANPAF